ncbi:EcsC family protein [Mesobacillus subterraneus]|uniref:ABC transporter substrate-binding protein n=1 Tax=Mesobacillus subterraneus TaxID=285983 RepID=A0A0D6ZG93_9BACI|nr:EcsC family protein [Mesobacillus subterraneus]KIY23653.1 ABC transporter substrate-binding protein [Mesobacillus subterraneus]
MRLTQREQRVLDELYAWENKLYDYEPNDLQLAYDRYLERTFSSLPVEIQERFFALLDSWLFHLHSFIQGSQLQNDAKERILSAGRVYNPDLETMEELKKLPIEQLEFIARQQIARHRLYSFVQGGISGSGGNLVLGVDMPAMAVINLRIVQLIAMTYGYEVNTPFEMMIALKVFHTSTMPSRMQSAGWEELENDLDQAEDFYFYQGSDDFTNSTWLEQPIKQIFKGMAILMFRKKHVQGMPILSMAIGAGANYQLTRRVTDFSDKFYQMRYFKEKGAW